MTPIPPKIRRQIDEDSFYKICIHIGKDGHVCEGRLTMEHAWLYAGEQIQEIWAIVPCCWAKNVDVSSDDKRWNQYVALLRATDDDLKKFPKKDWVQELKFLTDEFKAEIPHCLLPF